MHTPPSHYTEFPPGGYTPFDQCIKNHACYGEKINIGNGRWYFPHFIHFAHNYNKHKHYVYAKRSTVTITTEGPCVSGYDYAGRE
jgi:hypothetical protein